MTDVDSGEIEQIAIRFFQQNYSSFNIVSTTLEDNVWSVKVFVSLFGNQSIKTLTVNSKTGDLLKCE